MDPGNHPYMDLKVNTPPMSYSLNSLMVVILGESHRVLKGDTRSLEYGSYSHRPKHPKF